MKKKVLVIGSGGREHAIVYQLSRSPQVEQIFCAPGNAGIAQLAQCVEIADTDVEKLLCFAIRRQIDLCVVGPEAALAAGVADAFREAGIPVFGHSKAATQIESSKEFAKELMAHYNIPTAAYHSFADFESAMNYVRSCNTYPTVLKYDGLAAGKGVVIAQNEKEAQLALTDMLIGEAFGKGKVVIEDYLEGPEFSFMAFVDHHRVYPMPLSQDHKRAYDDDKGPNTGGMGAYTPLPFISAEEEQWALTHILQPVADAMVAEGKPLTGVLYGGLMKTADGIKVIEFNARFGDPETEVVLPLLDSDAFTVFYAIATGGILDNIMWRNEATVGVVMASCGYPGAYTKGAEINGVENFDGLVLHMGTKNQEGKLLTNGGRVLMCIAHGEDVRSAQQNVYKELEKIHCSNLFYRKDIAHWAL
jgi:phosphoribosylamine--glycine ligase